jgi:hypothetical protein
MNELFSVPVLRNVTPGSIVYLIALENLMFLNSRFDSLYSLVASVPNNAEDLPERVGRIFAAISGPRDVVIDCPGLS